MSNQSAWYRRSFAGFGLVVLAGCSDGSSTDVEVEVAVSPRTAELQVGATLEITATVTGATDVGVDWAAECGTVEGTGSTVTYTAPWGPGECEVTATSREDDSESASVQIAVTAIPVASNLLTNAGFDTALDPWTTFLDGGQPRAIWNALDARGQAGSGSAEIRHPNPGNGGTLLALNFCVPSAPGREYRLGGSAKRLQAITNAQVWIFVGPAADGCGEFDSDHWEQLLFPENGTEWTSNAMTFTAPAGTTTVRMSIGIWKEIGVPNAVTALVDDLFLVEE
jgi:hypothetical protein